MDTIFIYRFPWHFYHKCGDISRQFRGTSRRKCPALGRTDAAGEILTYWCLSERKWPLDRADRSQRSPFYTTHKCKVSSQVLVCAFANRSQPTKIQNGLCTRMQRFIFFFPSSSTTTSKGSNLAIDRAVVIVCTTHDASFLTPSRSSASKLF